MTVPAGWSIMMANSALHMDPNLFDRPSEFNPSRWEGIDSITMSKKFMPFGGGIRQCPGSDYTRVLLSIFLHLLVTKFKWDKISGGDIYRNPVLGFGGLHVKISVNN
ncbi:hypothetical protein MLD38_022978 [Melastoma candidum]|uniref:Uncharacterized protein n=1 Tax=Melastoma candidum TaxID=119954 RepID=A0ACB9QL74_9MYRT|nr:hypothetical protein MLD38_022978 [Melastoma candidum]